MVVEPSLVSLFWYVPSFRISRALAVTWCTLLVPVTCEAFKNDLAVPEEAMLSQVHLSSRFLAEDFQDKKHESCHLNVEPSKYYNIFHQMYFASSTELILLGNIRADPVQ